MKDYRIEGRDAAGRLLDTEYYGACWLVAEMGKQFAVLIPDPGDGSALPLAEKIMKFLNETATD